MLITDLENLLKIPLTQKHLHPFENAVLLDYAAVFKGFLKGVKRNVHAFVKLICLVTSSKMNQ